jgi:hypothetical protein
MRVCRYRRRTQLEDYMYGVTFRSSWPNGVSMSCSFPWFPFSPYVNHPVSPSEKKYSCTLGMGGCVLYSGLFLKENGEEIFLWESVCRSLTWNPLLCVLSLLSHRNRRYVPRQRFQQAYARPPSDLRNSATSAYSFPPFLNYCRRDI